jgi:MYXO-CTERM domain-containing protein
MSVSRTSLLLVASFSVACANRPTRDDAELATVRAALPSAGPISVPREQFATTVLGDGRVALVGGGNAAGDALASVELFDPLSNRWVVGKPMETPARVHTATYLPKANRLFVYADGGFQTFDPVIQLWEETDLGVGKGRRFHSATLLDGGTSDRVLLVGGSISGLFTSTAEIYRASDGTLAPVASLSSPISEHRAVTLANGHVMVLGGRTAGYLALSETYDPQANVWTSAGSMRRARFAHAAVRLSDGKVLVVGGYDGSALKGAELWDPISRQWSHTGQLVTARAEATATLLSTGRVLVIGGTAADANDTAYATTEVYDPPTQAFVPGPSLSVARYAHAAVPIGGGRILVVGGRTSGRGLLATTEIFGGLADGQSCVIAEECLSGICASAVCRAPVATDVREETAAPRDAATETAPPRDASPIVPEKPIAAGEVVRCTDPSQCASSFCVEGVCCDRACDAPCETCSSPSAPGRCTLEPYGTDRKNACGAQGSCIGTCDGKGKCVAAGAGSQCAPTRCVGSSTGEGSAYCSAQGAACTAPTTTFECAPYACEPALGACNTTCSRSDQCAYGFVCDTASRTCLAPAVQDDAGCAVATSRVTSPAAAAPVVAVALALAGLLRRRRERRDG